MLKLTKTYQDYDGVTRTEDFYFNLTKAELTTMQMTVEGGLRERLEKIVKSKDQVGLMNSFKEILRLSYGVKSPDGRRFMKSDDLFKEFEETPAYSEIFMDLCTNEKMASDFIAGILPADLVDEATKETKGGKTATLPTSESKN